MARRPQGTVVPRQWKSGTGYALRVPAYGKRYYVTLGTEADGWTEASAEVELDNIMADVRRGIWTPPKRREDRAAQIETGELPIFREFAYDKWLATKLALDQDTIDFYRWALVLHLVPYLGDRRLDEITVPVVDEYRAHMIDKSEVRRRAIARGRPLRDRARNVLKPMKASTINKTIDVLQSVLELAIEYHQQLTVNVATGPRRRMKVDAQDPARLDTVEQIVAVLDAGEQLDHEPKQRIRDRQVNLAGLLFAGFRAHEHGGSRWKEYDFANGRIKVGKSKTQAGLREVTLLPVLRHHLRRQLEQAENRDPGDLVYPTRAGTPRDRANLNNRIVRPTLDRASEILVARGHPPLPDGLSTHKLRKVFASIRVACGADPIVVMTELGHTDPNFSMKVYTHMMGRSAEERARLKALVEDHDINGGVA